MSFCSARQENEHIKCRFCNVPDNDGHLFLGMSLSPFLELRQSPEFASLKQDRTKWPRCMLWHGLASWLDCSPGLTARPTGSPWAVAASDLASQNLEKSFGPYPICTDSPWILVWDRDDAQDRADSVQPDMWSDGCGEDVNCRFEGSCHIFVGVNGLLQTVQRAEYWDVTLALQAFSGIHIGIDNLKVLGSVAKLIDRGIEGTSLPLVKEGDL